MNAFFPKLTGPRKAFGLGAAWVVARREGGDTHIEYTALEEAFHLPGERPKARLLARADAGNLAKLLGGFGHPDRIRVATAVMTGSNTHALLKKALGIKTGPLYHHLRELRLAELLETASRNFYVLTGLGEFVLLVATAFGPMTGRKPVAPKRRTIRCA